jgi:hypothetical protein
VAVSSSSKPQASAAGEPAIAVTVEALWIKGVVEGRGSSNGLMVCGSFDSDPVLGLARL